MSIEYHTSDLDYLGIVAGVCEQIDLIGQIDARIPDTGWKVSVGHATQAMVLNGLGFVGRALYLTPEFYKTKPVDLLVGDGIEASDLNSDSLGKALDYLYQAGITELFASVSAHALRTFGIGVRFAHLDTTAFSLQGAYEMDNEQAEGHEEHPMHITYGYSKNHRPDLKQAILGLICANRTSIPTYLSAMSLKPEAIPEIPKMTVQVARAAFRKGNSYMQMRDTLGTFFTDDQFMQMYPADGQPAYAPWRLALVSVMKFAENLTDRQTADAVRARIDWKYALSLELTDEGFDFSVLSEFRQRLLDHKAGTQLLNQMLSQFQVIFNQFYRHTSYPI